MKAIPAYRLIVVSGPTREWIDPVRFLSNPSTGSMGWHLAHLAKSFYKDIIYISGPGEKAYRKVEGVQNIFVESTQEMRDAVHNSICDHSVLIMAAAPADYYCKNIPKQKIKKKAEKTLGLELAPTADILKSLIPLASSFKHFYRVGFAAETQDLIKNASRKLKTKELFLICANEVYRDQKGFDDHHNTLHILDQKNKIRSIGPAPKAELALSLLDILSEYLTNAEVLSSTKQQIQNFG